MNALFEKVKSQGVNLLAFNRGDSPETVKNYFAENKFSYTPVMAPVKVHQAFGVRAYPTNYVVDSEGKVIARFVGWNEDAMKDALKSKGIKVD
ncbi:MAG: hypothetical protein KatS3mg015_0444 [Fimbriimonadales bacterium]|nr:MAG: hypothetical protein KatS3mg015_0444 [Fimbriimonadales bacterium]